MLQNTVCIEAKSHKHTEQKEEGKKKLQQKQTCSESGSKFYSLISLLHTNI